MSKGPKEQTPSEVHAEVSAAYDKLSDEERVQTLVDAGILSKDHKLTKRYGGEADPEQSFHL